MRLLTGSVALALSLVCTSARAQNADPFFHGDEAALSGGAVVASGRDSGSFWYNPAGFGGLKRGLLSASASTFGLRFRHVPDAVRVTAGPTTDRDALSSTDVISVPNAVVAATAIGDRFAIAAGLLTTQRDVRSALLDLPPRARQTFNGATFDLRQRLDLQTDVSWYHFGGAFAAEVTKRLRIGGALYGSYAKYSGTTTYLLELNTPTPPPEGVAAFVYSAQRITNSGFATTASVGVQYEVSPRVTMGATVRAPEFVLTTSTEGGTVAALSSTGGGQVGQSTIGKESSTLMGDAGTMIRPARVFLASAFALGPRQSWLELGVDVAHGVPASALFPAQRPVFNARIGARYMLSPSWVVGAGLFTDRSIYRQPSAFGITDKIDWYGLTAGVSKRTPLSLVKNPAPEAIVLVTTLSLRAAVGPGQAIAFDNDLNIDGAKPPATSDVVFFEVMPYLGSAVVF